MLERCGRLWLSRRWPSTPRIPQQITQRTTTIRYNSNSSSPSSTSTAAPPSSSSSSSTKPKRKLSSSKPPSGLKTWHRLALGAAATLIIIEIYRRYNNSLVSSSFKVYTLVSRDPVSSTASILHLRPKDPHNALDESELKAAWKQGIWNVQIKQPQIQIVRAYTPLPPVEGLESRDGKETRGGRERGELRLLIRHDPHGEVSSYLHRLPVGADIELRGPNLEYPVSSDVRQVLFYAGGTGIATALQVAHAMLEGQGQTSSDSKSQALKKKIHILWASRKREDCAGGMSDTLSPRTRETATPKSTWSGLFSSSSPPKNNSPPTSPPETNTQDDNKIVAHLNALKRRYPGHLSVSYFVNAEGTYIDDAAVLTSLSHFDVGSAGDGGGERQILISGPNGFISHLAGPKEWRGGRETQGDVKSLVAHAVAKRPVEGVKIWKV